MSERNPKRFWKEAAVEPEGDGFGIRLDGRAVKTPAKAALVAPTEALARAIAAEWAAQNERVDPATMPFTRSANAAIDKVTAQHDEVAEMIAGYGDSDLLCYRALEPVELVSRQATAWDPVLDWARERHGIDLAPVSGVIHKPQNPDSLAKISARAKSLDPFQLTAFHDLVGLSGSFILALAAIEGHKTVYELWSLSRLDETWQEEQWGVDDEAATAAAIKKSAFEHAWRFYSLVTENG